MSGEHLQVTALRAAKDVQLQVKSPSGLGPAEDAALDRAGDPARVTPPGWSVVLYEALLKPDRAAARAPNVVGHAWSVESRCPWSTPPGAIKQRSRPDAQRQSPMVMSLKSLKSGSSRGHNSTTAAAGWRRVSIRSRLLGNHVPTARLGHARNLHHQEGGST